MKKCLQLPITLTFLKLWTFVSQFWPIEKSKIPSNLSLPCSLGSEVSKTVLDCQNRKKFMATTAKRKFYFKFRMSPSLKIGGLHFEIKIWICCQSHIFCHILMIKDSFGMLRTNGIWLNNFSGLFWYLTDRRKWRRTKKNCKNRLILDIFQV